MVCAIDRDAHSLETLKWASNLTADFRATLSIVHAGLDPSLAASSELKLKMSSFEKATLHIPCTVTPGLYEPIWSSSAAGTIGRSAGWRTNAYGIIRQSPCPVLSI
jgi:hypothetical protein